jgi:hypothetical protein
MHRNRATWSCMSWTINCLTMNRMIYASFDQEFEVFQRDPRVMSLERYRAMGEHLMMIQEEWDALTAAGRS